MFCTPPKDVYLRTSDMTVRGLMGSTSKGLIGVTAKRIFILTSEVAQISQMSGNAAESEMKGIIDT